MCDQLKRHAVVGKTIASVKADSISGANIDMSDRVEINFTDGSRLVLKTDWYGRDCYISEQADPSG